jgi:hypothetical protein
MSVVIALLQHVVISLMGHLPLVDTLSLEVGMVEVGLGMVDESGLDVSRLLPVWLDKNRKTRQLR